jgi:hypothetical protein
VSPAGGRLLTENGLAVAQNNALHDNDPAFLHGVLPTPGWLQLGGDARFSVGMVDPGSVGGAVYPMQADLYASAGGHGFTVFLEGGIRSVDDGGHSPLWSREHYVMWQQNGLYIRVGRFAPVYGLRLAEHVAYTQRYGGDPLYDEAYGAAVEYVTHAFEIHATGFVHDPIAIALERGDGGALYSEIRIGEHAAVGAEGKYSSSSDQHLAYGGLTAKLYLAGPKLLLLGEAEVVRRRILGPGGDTASGAIGYIHASRSFSHGLMLDLGLGHYTEDTRVAGLYRDAFDADLHWFQTSHIEWLLTTRVELLDHGDGTNGGYALVQIHYRL